MNEKNQSLIPSDQHSTVKTTEDLLEKSVVKSHSTASEMVAAQTEAEVKAGFSLAQLAPRNEERARVNIVTACKNLRFAEKCIFKKPMGGNKFVEGPSIRFAEEMLRNWCNVKIQQITIYDDPQRRIVRVICYDLQANIPYGKDIIIEKTVERKSAKGRTVISERVNSYGEKVSLVVATEDEVMNKENALVSKSIRNNGLRLIPSHIVDEALDTARETMKAGIDKDPMAVMRSMLNSFQLLGISVEDIEGYMGHKIDQTNSTEITQLQSIYNTIKSGESKWSDYLENAENVKSEPEKAKASNWDELEKGIKPGDESKHTPVDQSQG